MSFEGYYQIICTNGHLGSSGDLYMDDGEWKCNLCEAKMAWIHTVDLTNGSFEYNDETGEEERIDGYVDVEEDTPADISKCPTCGVDRVNTPATYKIPEGIGRLVS